MDYIKDIYQGASGIHVELVAEFVEIHRLSCAKVIRNLPVTA
jgi:hypothetical protein